MNNYYAHNLNATKLFDVYETKIQRVKQYLDAEINFIRVNLKGNESVLELGAGYGRIMKELAPFAKVITGIDIAENSVNFGREYLKEFPNCALKVMDVNNLEFDAKFDVVLCLQNGISAFKANDSKLIEMAVKILNKNGKAYFSSYSAKFWHFRLAWFQEQAEKGLLGAIDVHQSKEGKIVCKDGFTATTYSENDLERLGKASGCEYDIHEVDKSSLFLVITK